MNPLNENNSLLPKSLSIAAIVPYAVYPAKMGGQKGIALFYEYLSKLLPATILSTGKQMPHNFAGDYISVLGVSKFRYINPFLFLKVKREIIAAGATHLVLEHPYFGWLGIMLKKACRVKLVVHSHNIEALRFRSMNKWWWIILWQYEKFTHSRADINFFITDEDRVYAIDKFKLNSSKCHTITYGIEMDSAPALNEKRDARQRLQEMHGILPDETILLFNGTLSYIPNQNAVDNILEHINPALLREPDFKYKIIICGKGLPARYDDLRQFGSENIIYAGFVDDITVYFKGADIFLNPIADGGGIKTKLVEALGYNNSAVSNESGAFGVPTKITGDKLHIVKDGDWNGFVSAIFSAKKDNPIPATFFHHFYWGNIAAKAASILSR